MRYVVTVAKDGATQQSYFQRLNSWMDRMARYICTSYSRIIKLVTIGDQVNHNIKYVDNDGMTP